MRLHGTEEEHTDNPRPGQTDAALRLTTSALWLQARRS